MTKTNVGRAILGLLSLFFIGTGLVLMFSPATMLKHLFIEPVETVAALSSIRAIWGGPIIAMWISVLLGAIRCNLDYVLVGFLSLLMVLAGRLVGFCVDGSFPELVVNIVPTIIAIALMLIAYKLMASPAA